MVLFSFHRKVCMEDYAHTLDMSKVYQDLNNGIDTNLHQLKPEQEYTAFIEANKWYYKCEWIECYAFFIEFEPHHTPSILLLVWELTLNCLYRCSVND